jgi:hypothetical protein
MRATGANVGRGGAVSRTAFRGKRRRIGPENRAVLALLSTTALLTGNDPDESAIVRTPKEK